MSPTTPPRPATPQGPATGAHEYPPGAPQKAPRSRAETWADVVSGMRTMSVDDAKQLKPKDIGVCVAPFMLTEEEMKEYRKHRAVHVVSLPDPK